MPKGWYWKHGEWNVICDDCGFKFKSGQLLLKWDGSRVCKDCYETRHPQELLRPRGERQGIPWSRPDALNIFTNPVCTVTGIQGIAGLGTAGCAVVGRDLGGEPTNVLG